MPRLTDELARDDALRIAQQRTESLAEDLGLGDGDEEYFPDAPPYGDDGEDLDILDLNDPDVETFGEPPLLGGRAPSSDMYGSVAQTMGRATSPSLFVSASQFPTAVQFRVWRWENGIPVLLGAIAADASDEDFIRQFYAAMPGPGDNRFQFRFRPVDMNGKELGQEFTKNISEHHSTVVRIRNQKAQVQEERSVQDPILINQGGDGGAYAEEMGRMFEHAVEASERRTEVLQQTLEDERARLREEEKSRYVERADLANRSTDAVQKITERLMESDRQRAKEQLSSQTGQSDMMLKTLTTVFSQQQTAARDQADRLRVNDDARMQQDREYFDRHRQDSEDRRRGDRQEWEKRQAEEREKADRRSVREKEEGDRRLKAEKDRLDLERVRIQEQRKFELEQLRVEADRQEKDAERRREADREESRTRREVERENLAREARGGEERHSAEREYLRAEADRRREEADRRREVEKEENRLRIERERLQVERQKEAASEERARWQAQIEAKQRADREEWERKRSQEREDGDRRERSDRERVERERQDFQLRMERERQEREDAANRRTETSTREENRRQDQARQDEERRKQEMDLRIKQIEVDAQRGREHQERMAQQSNLDREAQREAQERRDRIEREAREATDRDRQRQHELQMREMEAGQQRDREHQERMLQLQGGDSGGGGSLFGTLGEQLGMEAPELLEKLFGGGDGDGWTSAVPKVLGSLAEMAKAALTAKAEQQVKGRRRVAGPQQGQIVQTPQGPMVLVPGGTRMTSQGLVMAEPGMAPVQPAPEVDLPDMPFNPPGFVDEVATGAGAAPQEPPQAIQEPVDTLARAKVANMSLQEQKRARKGLRGLGAKLNTASGDEWLGIITEAITAEPSIFYYLRAVTVEAALSEASGNGDLNGKIILAMKDSGLIPADVPYNEVDFARLQSEKSG